MKYLLIKLIILYQKTIGFFLVPSCRFTPSCSEYTKLSIMRFGVAKGMYLSSKRLLKCNPWGGSGHDPVPEKNR